MRENDVAIAGGAGPCAGSADMARLMDGTLEASAVRAMFLHRRGCARCREAFDRAKSARVELRARREDAANDPAFDAAPPKSALVPWFLRPALDGSKKRRRLPWIVILAAAIGVLVVSGRGLSEDLDDAAFARAALARGGALLRAPVGPQEGRPRAATAILPSPVSEATLVVVDREGRAIFERRVVPGEDGVALLPHRVSGLRASVDAWRLAVPFPKDDVLPLSPGAPYGVHFRFQGGLVAAGAPFTIP